MKNVSSHRAKTVLRAAGFCVLGLIALIIIALSALTLWLTPDRLTEMVNKEASAYLNADVRASNVRFTVWSSFPRFRLEWDSLRVVSRNLDNIDASLRAGLPQNSDSLASTGSFSGDLNLLALAAGKIKMKDVRLCDLRLNLVAVNDTLNNYDIVPQSGDTRIKIPEIVADSVALISPRALTYYDVRTGTSIKSNLKSARLTRIKRENNYNLLFAGTVSVSSGNLRLLSDFPFRLTGVVGLHFNPFRLKFSDSDIALGNTRGHLDLTFDLQKMQFGNFSYSLDKFNLLDLASYLPESYLPALKKIQTDVYVSASASLASPYSFATDQLPDVNVGVKILPGEISLEPLVGRAITVDYSEIAGNMYFNGNDPAESYFKLDNSVFSWNGSSVGIEGVVTHLTTEPHVEMRLTADGALQKIAGKFPELKRFALNGNIKCDTKVEFDVNETAPQGINDIKADSEIKFSDVKAKLPESGASVSVSNGTLSLSTAVPSLTNIADSTVLKTALTLESVGVASGRSKLLIGKTAFDCVIDKNRMKKVRKPAPVSQYLENADIAHTPVMLTFDAGETLRKLLNEWNFTATLKSEGGKVVSDMFPANNRIGKVDVTLTPEKIVMNRVWLQSGVSSMNVSGEIDGIRDFILTSGNTILPVAISVNIGQLNINELAGNYEKGLMKRHGSVAEMTAPKPATLSASDTIAMLLPRNIKGNIKITAKETVYTNLHLYNLATTVKVEGGNLYIPRLNIGSDFGEASANITYLSDNVNNLSAHLGVNIDKINVVRFFENFHALLEMMPQMKNLSGFVSANMTADMNIFPKMYLDIPSVTAKIGVQGRDLRVHQDAFIRKITNMMLIHTDDDIHIENMNVRASVHDNLLELYPFDFVFDRYTLRMQGINNFAGDMYYHIGILKSPVPFDFGINIEGEFGGPKLRFGGAKYKVDQAEKIAARVEVNDKINIMREVKYFLRKFIHNAAVSATGK